MLLKQAHRKGVEDQVLREFIVMVMSRVVIVAAVGETMGDIASPFLVAMVSEIVADVALRITLADRIDNQNEGDRSERGRRIIYQMIQTTFRSLLLTQRSKKVN